MLPTGSELHMPDADLNADRLEAVKTYFRRVDSGGSTQDLFTHDVAFFFPKFGTASGHAALADFEVRMKGYLSRLSHDVDSFVYHVTENSIVVEGRESGITRDGTRWPDGIISQGRFCNVFEFDGTLIRRLFIYVDPDFTNADTERVELLHDRVSA